MRSKPMRRDFIFFHPKLTTGKKNTSLTSIPTLPVSSISWLRPGRSSKPWPWPWRWPLKQSLEPRPTRRWEGTLVQAPWSWNKLWHRRVEAISRIWCGSWRIATTWRSKPGRDGTVFRLLDNLNLNESREHGGMHGDLDECSARKFSWFLKPSLIQYNFRSTKTQRGNACPEPLWYQKNSNIIPSIPGACKSLLLLSWLLRKY